jgi:hypothetical protein
MSVNMLLHSKIDLKTKKLVDWFDIELSLKINNL